MSGPFYFAWVTADATTFGAEHHREDEEIYAFTLTQAESDFAQLSLIVRNPRVGLLAPTRKVWAWFAWRNPETDVVQPLFFGRLLGLPQNIFQELVTFDFIARPSEFATLKAALAENLKVA